MKTKITILLLFICALGFSQQNKVHTVGRSDTVYVDLSNNNFVRKANVVYMPILNDEATALFARVDEQPDNFTKSLINNDIEALKSTGLWGKLYVFYCFSSSSDSSILENWINSSYKLTYPAIKNKPYFFKFSGIESNNMPGAISYMNTNFNQRTILPTKGDSLTFGVYLDDSYKYFGNTSPFGAFDNTQYLSSGIGREATSGGVASIRYTNINSAIGSTVVNIASPITGLFNYIRLKNNLKVYNGVTKVQDGTATYTATVDNNIYLNCYNYTGFPYYASKATISFFYIAKNFTETDVINMNTILSNHMVKVRSRKADVIYENAYCYYKLNRSTVNGQVINNARILYQIGAKKLIAENDTIYFSLNAGITYPYKVAFPETNKINASFIYSNNSILVTSADNKVYSSQDSLATLTQLTIKDGASDYIIHTPVSATYPGNYLNVIGQIKSGNQLGQDIIILPAYTNVSGGAAPANLYFSADTCKTFKVAYKSGQNPNYRDDGTDDGGATGTLLGDASNPNYQRHWHDAVYSAYDTSWYACGGDAVGETMWIKGKYDQDTDAWTWDSIANSTIAGRFKSTGLFMDGDTLYWGSDDNIAPLDPGIFKCHIKDLLNTAKHITLQNGAGAVWDMIKDGNNIIALFGDGYFRTSKDKGITWSALFRLSEYYNTSANLRITPKDSNGWYSISDIGQPILPKIGGGTILIKLK